MLSLHHDHVGGSEWGMLCTGSLVLWPEALCLADGIMLQEGGVAIH